MEISMLIPHALWLLFSFFEGKQEAFWFHMQDFNRASPRNPHVEFTLRRAVVLLLCMVVAAQSIDLTGPIVIPLIVFLLGLMCSFPMVHDGAYYATRNTYNSNIYKDKWASNPIYPKGDMAAKFSLPWPVRSALFVIGQMFIIVSLMIK